MSQLVSEAEAKRLEALYRYLQLDTVPDPAFDLLAEAAAEICDVPYASVSLVDRDRVWRKAGYGLAGGTETSREESYCSRAIQHDFLEIPDLANDAATAHMSLVRRDVGAQMYAGASLVTTDGYHIGTLCVLNTKTGVLSERQKHILRGLAGQVMSLIELRAHERSLQEALQRAEYLAATDVLTGLANRRALFEKLEHELARCRRYGTPLSAVLIDLDHFKRVNDEHGHDAGDLVLRNVGQLITASIRSVDIAARYGGEELCVLLPQTAQQGALAFAEALRGKLAALQHELGSTTITVTASLGVASVDPALDCDAAQLIKAADQALYAAKDGGRNQVVAQSCRP
ncbi:sensor domain-containing diguanylate cyclase [Chitinimonas sp.]|uniref:GGDEF domain-containing protein n=1 Tax=Chitinimonas sp. TaxID=1934313 RepID=UPI002F93F841